MTFIGNFCHFQDRVTAFFDHYSKVFDVQWCIFRYSVDEYAAARRTAIVRCFIDALTRGGTHN